MLRRPTVAASLLALVLLSGCRDSPKEVVEDASAAAAKGDLVAMRERFSVTTAQRLERAWNLSNTSESRGWEQLATKMHFNGKALEVADKDVTIAGDYARVDARAGIAVRDYYLRKEDGRWRIELGAGMRYREAAHKLAEVEKNKKAIEEAKAQE